MLGLFVGLARLWELAPFAGLTLFVSHIHIYLKTIGIQMIENLLQYLKPILGIQFCTPSLCVSRYGTVPLVTMLLHQPGSQLKLPS